MWISHSIVILFLPLMAFSQDHQPCLANHYSQQSYQSPRNKPQMYDYDACGEKVCATDGYQYANFEHICHLTEYNLQLLISGQPEFIETDLFYCEQPQKAPGYSLLPYRNHVSATSSYSPYSPSVSRESAVMQNFNYRSNNILLKYPTGNYYEHPISRSFEHAAAQASSIVTTKHGQIGGQSFYWRQPNQNQYLSSYDQTADQTVSNPYASYINQVAGQYPIASTKTNIYDPKVKPISPNTTTTRDPYTTTSTTTNDPRTTALSTTNAPNTTPTSTTISPSTTTLSDIDPVSNEPNTTTTSTTIASSPTATSTISPRTTTLFTTNTPISTTTTSTTILPSTTTSDTGINPASPQTTTDPEAIISTTITPNTTITSTTTSPTTTTTTSTTISQNATNLPHTTTIAPNITTIIITDNPITTTSTTNGLNTTPTSTTISPSTINTVDITIPTSTTNSPASTITTKTSPTTTSTAATSTRISLSTTTSSSTTISPTTATTSTTISPITATTSIPSTTIAANITATTNPSTTPLTTTPSTTPTTTAATTTAATTRLYSNTATPADLNNTIEPITITIQQSNGIVLTFVLESLVTNGTGYPTCDQTSTAEITKGSQLLFKFTGCFKTSNPLSDPSKPTNVPIYRSPPAPNTKRSPQYYNTASSSGARCAHSYASRIIYNY